MLEELAAMAVTQEWDREATEMDVMEHIQAEEDTQARMMEVIQATLKEDSLKLEHVSKVQLFNFYIFFQWLLLLYWWYQ